jgi:hypothetical protein
MRGEDEVRGSLFSYVDLERRVRPDHPLCLIGDVRQRGAVEWPRFRGRFAGRHQLFSAMAPASYAMGER